MRVDLPHRGRGLAAVDHELQLADDYLVGGGLGLGGGGGGGGLEHLRLE